MVVPNLERSVGHVGDFVIQLTGYSLGSLVGGAGAIVVGGDKLRNGNGSLAAGGVTAVIGLVLLYLAGSSNAQMSKWLAPTALGALLTAVFVGSGFGLDGIQDAAQNLGLVGGSNSSSPRASRPRQRRGAHRPVDQMPPSTRDRRRHETSNWGTPRSQERERNNWG